MAMVCMVNKTAVDALSGVVHSPTPIDENISVLSQNIESFDECEADENQLLSISSKKSGKQYVSDFH